MFTEIFTPSASKEWWEHKTFAAKALRASSFGTRASEEKILREVKDLVHFIKERNGAAFDFDHPLRCTATNIILSVLLNKRHSWDSDELKMIKNGCERSYINVMTAYEYDMFAQVVPFWILKWFVRGTLKKIGEKPLNDYFSKQITAHRETFNPDEMRDILDYYIRDRTEAEFTDSKFIDTTTMFFNDAIMTASDVVLWAVLYLQCHPEEQQKAQEQLKQVSALCNLVKGTTGAWGVDFDVLRQSHCP